jgi:hypothetical protein
MNNEKENILQTEKEKLQEEEKLKKKKKQRNYFIVISLFVLIPALVYVVKDGQIRKMERKHKQEIEQIKVNAEKSIIQAHKEKLEIICEIFSWAVTTELSHKQTSAIDNYMVELVKIPEFQELALIGTTGKILLSTDKKFEGEAFSEMFPADMYFNKGDNKAKEMNDGILFTSMEIVVNKKLFGYLIITYKPTMVEVEESLESTTEH